MSGTRITIKPSTLRTPTTRPTSADVARYNSSRRGESVRLIDALTVWPMWDVDLLRTSREWPDNSNQGNAARYELRRRGVL
jgi:hypothetical protein